MHALLSPRKRAWAKQFKPKKLRGKPLNLSAGLVERYYLALAQLVNKADRGVRAEIQHFYQQGATRAYFAQDDSVAERARRLADAMIAKFQPLFDIAAPSMAETMVRGAATNSEQQLGISLQQLAGQLTIKPSFITGPLRDVFAASVTENVSLIRSIGQKYLQQVEGAIMRSITTGNGLADLVPFLKQQHGVTLRRARFIAEDQTRKAFNNLNKGRMQQMGITQYEWLHSHGSLHPRKLHLFYNGKVFSFDNPPVIEEKSGERGIPGQAINCKCRMVPVLSFAITDGNHR